MIHLSNADINDLKAENRKLKTENAKLKVENKELREIDQIMCMSQTILQEENAELRDMIELLPCPFCGSSIVGPLSESSNPQDRLGVVCCGVCGAKGPELFDGDELIRRWNARVEECRGVFEGGKMNLENLTPAPWESDESWLVHGRKGTLRETPGFAKFESLNRNEDAAFCALARNAFDVMLRRGWTVTQWGYGESRGKWGVTSFKGDWPSALLGMGPTQNQEPDPFTALVKADEWLKSQECNAIGPHHGDRCNGGRIQSPNAQFTQECSVCKGTGRK